MRKLLLTVITIIFVVSSCSKDDEENTTGCSPAAITTRQIKDKQATIKLNNGQFYMVEQQTIDTRLNPCNLEAEFHIDNLSVIISGEVKSTRIGSGPCCLEDFVITKITR